MPSTSDKFGPLMPSKSVAQQPTTESQQQQKVQNEKPPKLTVSTINNALKSAIDHEQFPFQQQTELPTAAPPIGGQTASLMCMQTTPTAPEHERKILVRSTRSFLKTLKTSTGPDSPTDTPATTTGRQQRSGSQTRLVHGNIASQSTGLSLPWPAANDNITANAGGNEERNVPAVSSSTVFAVREDGSLVAGQQTEEANRLPRVHFSDHDWIITSADGNELGAENASPLMSRTAAVLYRYMDKKPQIFSSALKVPKDPRNSTLGYQPMRLNDVKKQLNTTVGGATAAAKTASTGGANAATKTAGGGAGDVARRKTRCVSIVSTAPAEVRATSGGSKKQKSKTVEAGKLQFAKEKPKILIRPPKCREARFDREAASSSNNSESFPTPGYPLAHRTIEPTVQASEIGSLSITGPVIFNEAVGRVDKTQFQVRLHVPDLTYTKLFCNSRDGRDKVASGNNSAARPGASGATREKRFTDKYPYKLPDEYEDFQDGGDSVVEFAKRRFKDWFKKQMRTSPTSSGGASAIAPPPAARPTKKVHMQG